MQIQKQRNLGDLFAVNEDLDEIVDPEVRNCRVALDSQLVGSV